VSKTPYSEIEEEIEIDEPDARMLAGEDEE
jgi:hypothetical protein